MTSPKIRLSTVAKSFADVAALIDVTFEADDKESVVLIGPSASGKTVTLKAIIGLIVPDSGRIEIDGRDTVDLGEDEREDNPKMGMLFQRSALFDSLTVWENITFRLRQTRRVSRRDAIDIAASKLRDVGLGPDTAMLFPVELSGGMQKRVGIARALADDPEILLLDEPTAGLDPIMTNVINDLILENVRNLGATVISVTSDLDGARHIADRIVMLNEGRVVWTGRASEMDTADDPYIRQFVHKTENGPIRAGVA